MHWLHHEFRLYCDRKNIKLLRDDMRFIERRLMAIHSDEHRRIMREYVRIWIRELELNDNQNAARRKANEYLCGED